MTMVDAAEQTSGPARPFHVHPVVQAGSAPHPTSPLGLAATRAAAPTSGSPHATEGRRLHAGHPHPLRHERRTILAGAR